MLEFRGLVRRPRCGHLSAEKLFANRTSRHLATRQELSSKASFWDDFRIDYPPRSGQAAAGRGKMHDRPLSGFMMQTYASIVGTYGRFPRYRVRPRWHRVRGTSYSRSGVALGGVGSERHWLRSSHCVRALSVAKLIWFGRTAPRPRRRAWSIRTCGWRKHPFTPCRIDPAPTPPASLARDLAGHNGVASISCRVRHKYGPGACAGERGGQ
jgi:hypothetical protein